MRSDFQCNVFIFDYAGYGKSEGKPTAPGVLDDGLAALTYLNQAENIPTDQIIGMVFRSAAVLPLTWLPNTRSKH